MINFSDRYAVNAPLLTSLFRLSVCLSVRLSVCDAVESCVNRGRFAESVYTTCGARDLARLYKKNSANISQPFSPGAGVVM